jgi:hypothetical protein
LYDVSEISENKTKTNKPGYHWKALLIIFKNIQTSALYDYFNLPCGPLKSRVWGKRASAAICSKSQSCFNRAFPNSFEVKGRFSTVLTTSLSLIKMIANNDKKSPVVDNELASVQHTSLNFRRKLLVSSLVVLGLTCLSGVESYTRLDLTEPVETINEAVSSATVEQQGTLTQL